MKSKAIQFILLAALMCKTTITVSATCGGGMPNLPLPGESRYISIWVDDPNHGQVERSFALHLPAGYSIANDVETPLVLDFHGHGGSSAGQQYTGGLGRDAPFMCITCRHTNLCCLFLQMMSPMKTLKAASLSCTVTVTETQSLESKAGTAPELMDQWARLACSRVQESFVRCFSLLRASRQRSQWPLNFSRRKRSWL